ncbi:MAG: OmpA family protein [Flaviaesturariibacter sp.]|nr:OmpA family protein [Flaviaesturariibacter sp.]
MLLFFRSFLAVAQQRDSVILYFDFNKSLLSPPARAAADTFLVRYNSIGAGPVTLSGYCDSVGSDRYNDRLSVQRVAAVQSYLRSRGLDIAVIAGQAGYGRRMPVNENATPGERALNRRVTISWTVPGGSDSASAVSETLPADLQPALPQAALDTVRAGQTIRLRSIHFYAGRHTFLPQVKPVLEDLLATMKANPGLAIEIQGHICCDFSGYDQADFDSGDRHLSRNRAQAVYDYLVAGGVDAGRLRYRGFAGSRPLINPERTDEDRTLNRRVEILILRK